MVEDLFEIPLLYGYATTHAMAHACERSKFSYGCKVRISTVQHFFKINVWNLVPTYHPRPKSRFLQFAARIEHSIFRALHGKYLKSDMRISRSLRNYKFEFVIIFISKKSRNLTNRSGRLERSIDAPVTNKSTS